MVIDVEDVVDIDIYNRFDKYYRQKISVERDINILPKFTSRSLILDQGCQAEQSSNQEVNLKAYYLRYKNEQSATNETLPSMVEVAC